MRNSRTGFSLIELTVVVIIMGMMALMVVFIMGAGARPGYLIRSTARQVSGKMEQAKLMSGITGRLVRIEYDLDNQVLILKSQRELREDEDEPLHPDDLEDMLTAVGSLDFGDLDLGPDRSPIWLDSVETYDGEAYSRGVVVVDVRPKGTSIGHVVHLRTREDPETREFEEFTVELNPLTGQSRIYDYRKRVKKPERD